MLLEKNCTACQPNHCDRGHCSLDGNYKARCICTPGYSGDRCQTHTAAIAAGTTIGLALVAALSVFVWYRLRKDIRTLRSQDALQTKLLDEREKEINELEAVWTIQSVRCSPLDLLSLTNVVLLQGLGGRVWPTH
jgi:hypothetical protein